MTSRSRGVEAFLEVPGARLRYATSGPDESQLVLIHGSATDMTTWDGVVEQLAAHGKVVTYDRRGYGSSTHPRCVITGCTLRT